jgi:lysophosphatidate acyltransferase
LIDVTYLTLITALFTGYRNHSGKIDEFKKGAFMMALQSQVPIVPVVISSYNYFLSPKDKIFNSGKIIIEALPEIPTKGLKATDVNMLLHKTRNAMIEKFDTLNYELKNEQHKRKKY